MDKIDDYLQQAKECLDEAGKATDPGVREHYIHMAERWEELARQRAAHLHLEHVLQDILKRDGHKGRAGAV